MPSTYSPLLRIELQASGENDTAWGDKTNNNLQTVLEAAIAGMASVTLFDADYTMTTGFGAADEARCAIINVTGALTASRSVICPSSTKTYIVKNNTSGGFPITIKTAAGTGVSIVPGAAATVFCNGSSVELSQTPTADGSITPVKVDQTATYAWRFNGAIGINRAQPYVPNYGAFSMDGTTGSYITLYQGGVSIGTMSGTVDAFDLSSPNKPITFTTNGLTRVSISASGTVTVFGGLNGTTLTASGKITGQTLEVLQAATFGGTVTATGFNGVTSQNIITGLGYVPVQMGTGPEQVSNLAVKMGWSELRKRLKVSIEDVDLGNVVFDNTQGVFVPYANGVGSPEFCSNSGTTQGAATAPIVIRERARGGAQSGGGYFAGPRIGFVWGGQGNNGLAQIVLDGRTDVGSQRFWFTDNVGNPVDISARGGYFTGTVIQNASDERLKDFKGDLTDARKKLRTLGSYFYTWNPIANATFRDSGMQIGWSAQQVEKVYPELVKPAPFDLDADGKSKSGLNYKTVMYDRAAPILSAAINEHDEIIEAQALEIQRLQTLVTDLIGRVAALEK